MFKAFFCGLIVLILLGDFQRNYSQFLPTIQDKAGLIPSPSSQLTDPNKETKSNSEKIINKLIAALNDTDSEVRQNLGLALASFGNEALPKLIKALNDPDANRRAGAAFSIGHMNPLPQSAIPALLEALQDKDVSVRRATSYALSRIINIQKQNTLSLSPRSEKNMDQSFPDSKQLPPRSSNPNRESFQEKKRTIKP